MSTNKTVPTKASVTDFLKTVEDPVQQQDSFLLMEQMKEVTGQEPVMWGPGIIGFGRYEYRYESGREGSMPAVGFSPRKGRLALYIGAMAPRNRELLAQLGQYSHGKSCLYIKRLTNVELNILRKIISNSYFHNKNKHH